MNILCGKNAREKFHSMQGPEKAKSAEYHFMQGGKMVTKYHHNVQSALLQFGSNQKTVNKCLKGDSKPISIVEPKSKYVVNYQPDTYYLLKNRKKIIFEILESELKKQDIIIADVIRSCLVENVSLIIFIHPSKRKSDEARILEALYTVTKGIAYKGVPAEELPRGGFVYLITRQDATNRRRLISKIEQFCKKDRWLT